MAGGRYKLSRAGEAARQRELKLRAYQRAMAETRARADQEPTCREQTGEVTAAGACRRCAALEGEACRG